MKSMASWRNTNCFYTK